jgi:hypothetical protein
MEAKVPVEQVSRILGHSSVRVTVDVDAADLPLHLDDAGAYGSAASAPGLQEVISSRTWCPAH